MTHAQLVKRVEQLEREVSSVKQKLAGAPNGQPPKSADDLFGMFRNDPDFKKAMELGAAYRRSLRPGHARRARKK